MNLNQTVPLSTTRNLRYPILDGLRGVAAISVLALHLGSEAKSHASCPHGYLAVDLFFMLSGFVLANAYSERLKRMTLRRFVQIRLQRMLPMSVFGVLLGTAFLLVREHLRPEISDHLRPLLAASALNLLLIPKLWVGAATGHAMYPADGPLWSLLLEIFINLVWAAWFLKCSRFTLMVTTTISFLLFVLSIHHFGDAALGWNWKTLPAGIARVTFGFFTGVLLWRHKRILQVSPVLGWCLSCAALIAVVSLPKSSWWADVLLVGFALPAILFFAIGVPMHSRSIILDVLGDISYPLYTIHVPILIGLVTFFGWDRLAPGQNSFAPYFFCLPIIVLAYALNRWFDVPFRRWLTQPAHLQLESPTMPALDKNLVG